MDHWQFLYSLALFVVVNLGGFPIMPLTACASLKMPHCGIFRAFGAPQPPFGWHNI